MSRIFEWFDWFEFSINAGATQKANKNASLCGV
jgi:hypothetical protein